MSRLTAATIILAVVLVCDLIANITQADSEGWDLTATLFAFIWGVCLTQKENESS